MKTGSLKAALFFRTKAVFFYIKKVCKMEPKIPLHTYRLLRGNASQDAFFAFLPQL